MVEPLVLSKQKGSNSFQTDSNGNLRCGRGILKKGKRKGEQCRRMILSKDDLSIACHNCGEKYSLLELLEEVKRLGYLEEEETSVSLKSKGGKMKKGIPERAEELNDFKKKAVISLVPSEVKIGGELGRTIYSYEGFLDPIKEGDKIKSLGNTYLDSSLLEIVKIKDNYRIENRSNEPVVIVLTRWIQCKDITYDEK